MRKLLAILVIAIIVGYGCMGQGQQPQAPPDNATGNGTAMIRQVCESSGGHWNECGSACRGAPPDTACVLMCVQYCECGGIAGFRCPSGYECTDYLPDKNTPDASGICKKLSPSGK